MHLAEGILPLKWAGAWFAVSLPFMAKGLAEVKEKAKTDLHLKPFLGLMTAAVFIISCMPVPVPTAGTCSHPCGTGMAAIFLGPFTSILIASIVLVIQALFLAHGGLTTLGADIVSMGIIGSLSAYGVFKLLRRMQFSLFLSGFIAAMISDWATYAATSFELASALHGNYSLGALFISILIAFIPTQVPLGLLEGFVTGSMLLFVSQRRPDILKGRVLLFLLFCLFGSFFIGHRPLYARDISKWEGVDTNVVEKVAAEHGRKAWKPLIPLEGDLEVFAFLVAGVAGGFILGFYWRMLFSKKDPSPPSKEAAHE